jgi:hypothetical protein
MDAHAGTAGVGELEGVGDGDGLGEGLGLGLGLGDGVGELWEATIDEVLPQPARTMTDTIASTPTLKLTGHTNDGSWNGVTGRTGDTGRKG